MIAAWTFALDLQEVSLRLNKCYSLSNVNKSGRCNL